MKNNGIWVFRLSVTKSGNPKSKKGCPLVDVQSISEYRRNVLPLKLKEYDKEMEEIEEVSNDEIFSNLKSELFEHGRLRQGWGWEFDGMSLKLNQPEKIWIENYMKIIDIRENETIPKENACGRWNILKRMTEMKKGNIVFIPRIPDESQFTVATVDNREYFFLLMEECFDYGNVIGVKNIKKYSYGEHFPAKTFSPYQSAISQIKNHHKIFELVGDFVEEFYL